MWLWPDPPGVTREQGRYTALEARSCMTVSQFLVALLETCHTIALVEYGPERFSALDGKQQEVVHAVGRTLTETGWG